MSYSQNPTANEVFPTGNGRESGKLFATIPLRFFRTIREYFRCQQDYQNLLAQPDYLLKDIGLTREQIIAAKHVSPVRAPKTDIVD